MEPIRNHGVFRAHQASDSLQDGFEIVLLWLAPEHHVEGAVDLLLSLSNRIEVCVVLRRVEQDSGHTIVANRRLPLGRVRVADDVALFVQKLCDLDTTEGHDAELFRELGYAQVRHLSLKQLVRGFDAQQEDHVMLTELIPLLSDIRKHASQAKAHLGPHLGGHNLAHLGSLDIHDLQALHRQRHARFACKICVAVLIARRPHTRDLVREVPSDLISGLQPEQVKVSEQVVVDGQELQIQFWQGQGVVAGVMLLGHEVGIPNELLRWIQRHLLNVVLLEAWPLQPVDQDLREQLSEALLLLRLHLFLPLLLGSRNLRILLLLFSLGLFGLFCSYLRGLLHTGQYWIFGNVQITDLCTERLQHLGRQRPKVLLQGVAGVQN
mmetsp:Transcript_71011/g.179168  ORF Transcript_71011/g.179168 Transcript_71011/m.179168 type:complete len:380 (-) Transcript_71011:1263-2402(-)